MNEMSSKAREFLRDFKFIEPESVVVVDRGSMVSVMPPGTVPPHDHDLCEELLLSLRPSQRFCHIPEDDTHGVATHAKPGFGNGVRPYCADCFADVYGPHNCDRLACPLNPCQDSGKVPEDE